MKESEKDVNMKTEVTLPGNKAHGSLPSSSGERAGYQKAQHSCKKE
jgi:hypothetical protein